MKHDIREWITLVEAALTEAMVNRLYHATGMPGLEHIFACDCLQAAEAKEVHVPGSRISFSRQPQAPFIERPAILLLNADKLRQSYRLDLRYGDSRRAAEIAAANPEEYESIKPRRETEESLSRDLPKLHRYLDGVALTTHWWEMIQEAAQRRRNSYSGVDELAIYRYLQQHRLPVLPVDLTQAGWQASFDQKAIRWSASDRP